MGRGSRRRRAARAALVVAVALLALAAALSLAACRDSEVLTNKIVGAVDKYELDETLDPVALENPESSSDISEEEDDSDREDEEDREDPDYDEDPDDDEETDSPDEDDYSDSDSDALSGDSVASGTTTSAVSNGGEGSSDAPSITFDFTGDSSYLGANDEDSTSDAGDEGATDSSTWIPSTSSSTGASNEASGTTVVQPGSAEGYSNMATVGCIAAAGSIATLVAAIGGGQVLAACNSDWYDDLPSSAFSDREELADTVCIDDWGDGSSMEDCYKQIANALPQDWSAAVLVDENTYESAYDSYFTERCIYVVVLEAYGTADVSDDWIADDVEVVAELIGTDYAKSQYQAWKELWTTTLKTVRQANGGYTIFNEMSVLGGDSTLDFLYKGGNETANSSGSVTNISPNYYRFSYVYSMVDANRDTVESSSDYDGNIAVLWRKWWGDVAWPSASPTYDLTDGIALGVPMSAQGKWSNRSQWATMDYYLQHAGAVNVLGWNNFYQTSTSAVSGTVALSDAAAYSYGKTMALGGFFKYVSESKGWSAAGDEDYPLVIVQKASYATRLQSSAATYDADSGVVGLYNTGQDYTIAVMPCGISGSWTYGTFESFLMAPYFYCLYQQGGDLSACDTYVSDFYTTFYRCGASVITSTSRDRAYGWYGYWVTAEGNAG